MGRNSRSRHEARKKKQKQQASRAAHRRREEGPFGTSENAALNLLVGMWEQLDHEATICHGPVVLHENGAFECKAEQCTEVTIFDRTHAGAEIVRCSAQSLKSTRHACVRCWNKHPHEVEPVCGGMVIIHSTGEQECTANQMLGGQTCPGVRMPHAVTVPCRTLEECERCGTDNKAEKDRRMREAQTRDERRSAHHGSLLRLKQVPRH